MDPSTEKVIKIEYLESKTPRIAGWVHMTFFLLGLFSFGVGWVLWEAFALPYFFVTLPRRFKISNQIGMVRRGEL